MAKATFFLILALTVTLFTAQVSADDDDDPPMYAVHDFASGKLQARRTIKAQKACDADFGTQLEAVVTKMEKNKDADAEFANKLRQQFMDLMENNRNKNLCEKLTWCDMGVCQKRTKLQNRDVGGGDGAQAPPEADVAPPTTNTTSTGNKAAMNDTTVPVKEPETKKNDTSETTSAAVAVREVKFFFASFFHWAALTVIALLIPRNV